MKKEIELIDNPETIVAVDIGEVNLATAVAISKANPDKPIKGQLERFRN